MKFNILKIRDILYKNFNSCVIYGAGDAGKAIAWYLKNIIQIDNYCFWDSNTSLQNNDEKHPILAPNKNIEQNIIYIIGFIENDNAKISYVYSYLCSLGIKEKNITIVDLCLEEYRYIQYMYIEKLINDSLKKKLSKEKIEYVKKIAFLANGYTNESEEKGSGGPIGAICMQKKYLGNKFKGIPIIYPYFKQKVKIANRLTDRYAFILEPISQINDIIEGLQNNAVYIVNDIFSAFALALNGKNYCLIYHGQGDIVQELSFWGEEFSYREKELVWFIEKIAIESAYKCYFPSRGAYFYFKKGFGLDLKCDVEMPLYNTLYDKRESLEVEGILKDEDKITFLSIGQMTWLKGIDRIPDCLEKLSKLFSKEIRWIVVADGVLKNDINKNIDYINQRVSNRIEYINIDYRISHQEVFYLMSISDVYIMLHRVSIFDFSTLEAMYFGRAVVLSNVPGNDEFNKEQNIMLIDEKTDINLVKEYIEKREDFGKLNKQVFERYFSEKEFITRYNAFLSEFIKFVERKE